MLHVYTDRIKNEKTFHQTKIIDYYNWIKTNKKKAITYIRKENKYTKNIMKDTIKLQKKLKKQKKKISIFILKKTTIR